jgi:hypothetical protein
LCDRWRYSIRHLHPRAGSASTLRASALRGALCSSWIRNICYIWHLPPRHAPDLFCVYVQRHLRGDFCWPSPGS